MNIFKRSSSRGRVVAILGAFPPPMNGAAKNTQLLFEEVARKGNPAIRINQTASSLSHRRSAKFHLERLVRNASAAIKIASMRGRESSLYIVPDGGLGAWYTLAHGALALLKGVDTIVIHHRTLRYVDNISLPMRVLTAINRKHAVHVFLSSGMADKFQLNYGGVNYRISGNARFVSQEACADNIATTSPILTIGHLSNLCREKGFFEVANTYRLARKAGIQASLHLAGPAVEENVEREIGKLITEFGDLVSYFGPLSGVEKDEFYRRLDVFLFPTLYDKEAAPNVVYEAMAAGSSVVATAKGCLPEMIYGLRGQICSDLANYADEAVRFLENTSISSESRKARKEAIKHSVALEAELAQAQHAEMIDLLCNSPHRDENNEVKK